MAPKIAILFYSMYGHVQKLAEAEKAGVEAAGGSADLIQIAETLPQEVLTKMHAPEKSTSIKTLGSPSELEAYDGFLLGIPTRYGNFPGQWKAFWDQTGGIWQKGGFHGKYVGIFVSTASLGGGQESTNIAAMSTLAHHGMIFVPLGYKPAFQILGDMSEVRGGSAWGAGTFAGLDGSRQPTEKEIKLAETQGSAFYEQLAKVSGTGALEAQPKKEESKPQHDQSRETSQQQKAQSTQNQNASEQPDEKKGPCGLPVKCTIL